LLPVQKANQGKRNIAQLSQTHVNKTEFKLVLGTRLATWRWKRTMQCCQSASG